jgi:predicted transcriptional regulator
MKQVLVQLDDRLVARLDRIAPGRSRRRSAFIREALYRALWELEERRTAEAYRRQPDSAEPVYFAAENWDPKPYPAARRKR